MSTVAQVRSEVAALSARLDQRPLRTPGPRRPYMFLEIIGGNTLVTGQVGIYYEPFVFITSVPSAYDANVDTTFINQVGRAILTVNNIRQPGYVLVVNDDFAGLYRDNMVVGDIIWARDAIEMPVDGGGTVLMYPAGN